MIDTREMLMKKNHLAWKFSIPHSPHQLTSLMSVLYKKNEFKIKKKERFDATHLQRTERWLWKTSLV